MASEMPVVNAEFGDRPTIEFPTEIAPAGLKVVELFEGNGPMVRRGDTGVPQAGIGGEDTLVFVIDIISTR